MALPLYKDDNQALSAGEVKGLLYFNWRGQLVKLGDKTNIWLNLSRAMSYLRRVF